MSKDSQIVQVSNPEDVDQVTRIPLDLHRHRMVIAIAAACIFTGGGLLPEILYIVLLKVAGLKLWIGTQYSLLHTGHRLGNKASPTVFTVLASTIGAFSALALLRRTWNLVRSGSTCRPSGSKRHHLDYFQWNFFTGFCYIAALMIAAISTSQHDDDNVADSSTRLISLPLPVLILQVSSQLLCACVMNRMHAQYPFRVSSMDRTALVRPGVYTIVEDVLAVDCGQGEEYRRLLDARYCSSMAIRVLLARLDLAWGLSGAIVAIGLIILIVTLSSRDTVFLIGWLVPWGWAGLLAVATRWMWDVALMHEKGKY